MEYKLWAAAIAASIPREGFLIGITGGAGAGKSSLVRALSQVHGFLACYPGKEVRRVVDAGDTAAPTDLGQMAPKSTENMVRNIVTESMGWAGKNSLVVDGFPRSRDQMKWINEITMKAAKRVAIVVVQVNPAVRRIRIKNRGEGYDAALLDARMQEETDNLQPFLRWLPTVADLYIEIANGVE